MIFIMFKCKSGNVDASIKIQTGNGYTIMPCISDFDSTDYSPFADGICCYPTALYDGNTIKFVANKTNAEIYTAQVDNFWWGVEGCYVKLLRKNPINYASEVTPTPKAALLVIYTKGIFMT